MSSDNIELMFIFVVALGVGVGLTSIFQRWAHARHIKIETAKLEAIWALEDKEDVSEITRIRRQNLRDLVLISLKSR